MGETILYKLHMRMKYLIASFVILLTLKSYAYQIYTVKKGDTLIGIAHKFGIKAKLIKEANPRVDWRRIRPKQKIKIPSIVAKKHVRKKIKITKTKTRFKKTATIQKPVQPSKQQVKTENKIYTIKKGDTLIGIAHKLHYSYEQIKAVNPKVDWRKIRPGQKIVLPSKHAVAKKTPKPGEIGDGYYIVAKGDTLRGIARRFGLTLKELEQLNPNLNKIIRPGELIVLPKELTEKIKISEKEKLYIPPRFLLYSEIYRVKRGDTLWKIARKFNTDIDIIRTLNDISGRNIRVGQILFVPSRKLKGAEKLKLRYSILNQERHALVRYAERFLGTPYRFGGESLKYGIDCSAFVQKIFSRFKIRLPRTAEEQYRVAGVFVPVNRLQPGDLLFFHTLNYAKVTHVAIYIGHGKFIHAAGRRSGVKISRFTKYYWKRFVGAKRVLGTGKRYAYLRNRSG